MMIIRRTPVPRRDIDRASALDELDWYEALVRRKVRTWGRWLDTDHRRILTDNFDRLAPLRDSLQFRRDKEGYYIGQVDEEGLRHGYGVYTCDTIAPKRWVMQAGMWHEGRPSGAHTLYDASGPRGHHYLASVYYTGERRHEPGLVQFTISDDGYNGRPRRYRRYERFSLATMAVGLSMIFLLCFALTRKVMLCLVVCAVIAFLYVVGFSRRQI